MTLYDSSVLIDYLDGTDEAIDYVESHLDERAIAPPTGDVRSLPGRSFQSRPRRC